MKKSVFSNIMKTVFCLLSGQAWRPHGLKNTSPLTGINDKAHIEAVIRLKPQGYLLKPPSKDALIAAIEKNLR